MIRLLVASAIFLPGALGAVLVGSSPPSLRGRARHAAKPLRRPCDTSLLGLAAAGSSFGGSNVSRIYADGYSRVGCEVDIAPESERTHFKENVCGGVPSCRAVTLGMEPRLCFDFCRTIPTAHFFGIAHGTDCYCSTYFHAQSTGGQGT